MPPLSCALNTILVSGRNQEYFTAPPTEDEIEMVQDIAPEDTQVRGGRIGEAGKLAADPYRPPIVAEKFHNSCDQPKRTRSPDPAQDEARRYTPGR